MKTFGLHKKSSLPTWGLRGLRSFIIGGSGWNEVVSFVLQIKRNIQFYMER